MLAVARGTTLDEVAALLGEAALGRGELEGPEELVDLLEVLADSEDLVDDVLDGEHISLAELVLNNLVISQGEALTIDLAVAALVHELADGLEVGVAPRNVGRDEVEHLQHRLRDAHKDAVVHLAQTQQLQDLAHLGRHSVDTAKKFEINKKLNKIKNINEKIKGEGKGRRNFGGKNLAARKKKVPTDADNEGELGLGLNVEVARVLGDAAHADLIALGLAVLRGVLLSALEHSAARGSALLLVRDLLGSALGLDLHERLLLLEDGLGDGRLLGGGGGGDGLSGSLGRHCG